MKNPMFNTHPVELGTNQSVLLSKIKADKFYSAEMKKAFSNEVDPFTIKNIQYCISSFVRSIVSFNSAYDKFINGDKNALSETQQEGMQLFFSDRLQCSSCHGGINFSTPKNKTTYYFNTGIYNIDSSGTYPAYDQGLIMQTKQVADMGAYRVPTLRNLGFTAPYYHDGSARTIDEVIDAYARGGRSISAGIYKGDGMLNPHKSDFIKGFQLTSQQRKALISFLFSLNDSTITSNPAFADPFKR
jgi:cytochrome c peroxidase